ncbi:hypothetical protein [Stygiolobus caldivivus]|uniref:Uncharacterized protein n=1 Tax=Stygiolobus caldivivus TaxID=2824673 RepID=A0A8D5U525_9CREN|nr:hypothetical protein [Stygiolobus caldivivus]BCU69051.1 hypothetical protein KN1_03480 [Stygiolobus caldivivus]
MNYKYYPVALAIVYTIISTILSASGLTEIRIYLILFTIGSILVELLFYPFPKPANYIIIGLNGFLVVLSLYYFFQFIGII